MHAKGNTNIYAIGKGRFFKTKRQSDHIYTLHFYSRVNPNCYYVYKH